MSSVENFTMKAGDTRKLDVTIIDESTGNPLNITGASLAWAFARRVSSTPLITKTIGSGIQVISAAAGTCRITLDPVDTQGLRGKYYHELEVTESDGAVTTGMTGEITIEPTFNPSI